MGLEMDLRKLNRSKMYWGIRALMYKPFFGSISFPSYIGKPTFISQNKRNLFLGKMVRIYPGARIEIVDGKGTITIGNNVSIGQNLHITSYYGDLYIGDNTVISGSVMINNNDHEYKNIDRGITDQPLVYKKTKIGKDCFIGYGAVILPGTILGEHCIVGANSVIRGKFEPYSVVVGAPGKVVKRYDASLNRWVKVTND